MLPPFRAAPRRNYAIKSAHFRAMRRPPLTLAVPSGDRQLSGMSRCDTLRSGAAVWRDLRNATQAAPALSAGTAALARRGIAISEQVPRSALVRHDVARLSARCCAAGSATARNAVGFNAQKSSIFAHRRSLRGRLERRLAVGSRLARLGVTTSALQRPSGANSAPPPRCLGGWTAVRRGASRDGMVVSTKCEG